MSVNSTPLQSHGSSPNMSSQPRASRSPINLTPRSKIQAMLAAIDSDDDDDAGSDKEIRRTVEQSPQRRQTYVKPTSVSRHPGQGRDSETEDEDAVRKRKPRNTARMQFEAKLPMGEDEEHYLDGNAYERVKKRLLGTKNDRIDHNSGEPSLHAGSNESQTGTESEADHAVSTTKRHRSPRLSRSTLNETTTPARPASSGLFLTPEEGSTPRDRINAQNNSGSDSDLPDLPKPGNRLKELVARKRQERLAKEKETRNNDDESELPERHAARRSKTGRRVTAALDSGNDSNEESERRLTQHIRPTRKASKKALEEMHRETQRMSRNMQLTHQAKTKTKFTTADFLAKFNFRQPAKLAVPEPEAEHASSSSIEAPGSDLDLGQPADTPPSSPPEIDSTKIQLVSEMPRATVAPVNPESQVLTDDEDDVLPDFNTILTQIKEKRGRLPATEAQLMSHSKANPVISAKKFSLKSFGKSVQKPSATDDSDDDLIIVKPNQPSRLPILDQIPATKANESSSLHALRTLAHLHVNDNARNKARKSMTTTELQISLQRRAKEQATRERDEKIQRLKDKGVIVMSAEEKEKDQLQLENMLEKARREADELAQKEKAAAKKAGKENDAQGDLPNSDDDQDEDWDGSADEGGVVLSGSEDEEADVESQGISSGNEDDVHADEGSDLDDDVDEAGLEKSRNKFLDEEAGENIEDEHENASEHESGNETPGATAQPPRRIRNRNRVVISDDEDEDEDEDDDDDEGPRLPEAMHDSPAGIARSPQSLSDAFGFAQTKAAIPGLSQVFAGTMSDSPPDAFGFAAQPQLPGLSAVFANTMADEQMSGDTEAFDSQPMEFLRGLPRSSLQDFGANFKDDSQSSRVQDSQTNEPQSALVHFDTQTQAGYQETQISQMPDPTPDVGFQMRAAHSPAPTATFATVATLPLPTPVISVTPEVPRKSRLVRRNTVVVTSDDEDLGKNVFEETPVRITRSAANAFDIMRDAGQRPVVPEAFDKKRSEAKAMVEDQAEESEDEYAGLGGASDDESQGDVDEETLKMIDDDGKEKVNEADIAAYYADKERINDEKQVEKLYRDIANGGLRRKRGADMDFFDSDDEDEAAARRRAAKQREFARMRKALLADEKLGKIAENPKQQAFLQAIEDREEDEDLDILEEPEENVSQITDSQQGHSQESKGMQATKSGKRTFDEFAAGESSKAIAPRLPPKLRPANGFIKPRSIAGIRNVISEVLGEPDTIAETQLLSSPEQSADEHDDEDDDVIGHGILDDLAPSHKENNVPPVSGNPRRTAINPTKVTVIDRIALKRGASNQNSRSHGAGDRLAFQAPTNAASSSFRKPSLLRRATTAGSNATSTSTDSTTDRAAAGKETVKMGGSKKSSVNFYVRENEKLARLEQMERERREGREKMGKMRRSGMGLGALVGGAFD